MRKLRRGAPGWGGLRIGVAQQGRELAAHAPCDRIGEQAQEDMGAPALGAIAGAGPDLETAVLEAAAGAFDAAEPLAGAHRVRGAEASGGQSGADDGEAVEPGLLGAALPVALEDAAVCGGLQVEVLGHDLARAEADPIPAGEATLVAPGGGEQPVEPELAPGPQPGPT